MLWKGWEGHVGCEECSLDDKEAECWGKECCHGYDRGCGCVECTKMDDEWHSLTSAGKPDSVHE